MSELAREAERVLELASGAGDVSAPSLRIAELCEELRQRSVVGREYRPGTRKQRHRGRDVAPAECILSGGAEKATCSATELRVGAADLAAEEERLLEVVS